jgi:hypothetical protein
VKRINDIQSSLCSAHTGGKSDRNDELQTLTSSLFDAKLNSEFR